MSLAELEDSLLRNVFRGYQKWVRPVQHANDTITVRFGLKISQLVDVVRNREVMREVGIVSFLYFIHGESDVLGVFARHLGHH